LFSVRLFSVRLFSVRLFSVPLFLVPLLLVPFRRLPPCPSFLALLADTICVPFCLRRMKIVD
jgi:hypothetical protein